MLLRFSFDMKLFFIPLFLISIDLQAATTVSDGIAVAGTVPVVLRVTPEQRTSSNYMVRELSNNPEGYQVSIETDSKTVRYDGKLIDIVNHYGVLTHIVSQSETIDTHKSLELSPQATYFHLMIYPN